MERRIEGFVLFNVPPQDKLARYSRAEPAVAKSEANVELIVRAVNAHERLIEALKEACRQLGYEPTVATLALREAGALE